MKKENSRCKQRECSSKKTKGDAIVGAAFLMATSAIGPGFLTQTAVFTEKYGANFSFAIMVSLVAAVVVQLNIWRVIGASGLRAQDIANRMLPGLGYFIAVVVSLGGLAFNIGNIGGAALGFQVLLGLELNYGILLSGILGAGIFLSKDIGNMMDKFTKILGLIMIVLIAWMAANTHPPLGQAALKAFAPDNYRELGFSILTLTGGTVGGYITFAGGHRLIDAKITGIENMGRISKSSIYGIVVAALVRILLFIAVLGVVSRGFILDPTNPPASAFKQAAGIWGYKIFGIVLLAAALTSVVGAAYTSVSFLKTFSSVVLKFEKQFIIGFIATSMVIMMCIGKPVAFLVLAGALNGMILPLTLGLVLFAAWNKKIVGNYRHSKVLAAAGAIIVAAMSYMEFGALKDIGGMFK